MGKGLAFQLLQKFSTLATVSPGLSGRPEGVFFSFLSRYPKSLPRWSSS